MNENDIVYEIIEEIGVVAEYSTGWKKEVNLVSCNNKEPKIDIRDWSPDHQHMSRGIILHPYEAKNLTKLLGDYFSKDLEHKINNAKEKVNNKTFSNKDKCTIER